MSDIVDLRVISELNSNDGGLSIDYLSMEESPGKGIVSTVGASLADDLPSDVTFDVMAFGGQATVCAATPKQGRRSTAYQSEAELEAAFIAQLQRQAYAYIQPSTEAELVANLRSQLAQQGALDRLPEVLAELPKTRADLGFPPLVTPTSQIVGVQSVLNVLSGKRYSMVTDETKRYAAGYYGRTPAPIAPKLRKQLCGDLKPISCRPADLLKPGLVKAAEELPPNTIKAEEDILSYALFPQVAEEFFKKHYTQVTAYKR